MPAAFDNPFNYYLYTHHTWSMVHIVLEMSIEDKEMPFQRPKDQNFLVDISHPQEMHSISDIQLPLIPLT